MVGDGLGSRIVCPCRFVTEEAVVSAIDAGAHDLLEVVRRTEAGTRCGACLATVWRLLPGKAEQ